jgi:hypothetical protein
MSPSEVLDQYVILHNQGVETADFEPLLAQFAVDAIFDFQDPPIGIFMGQKAIRELFRHRPPEFMLGIRKIAETGLAARAEYFDWKNPDTRLGAIKLETDFEKITRIVVGE